MKRYLLIAASLAVPAVVFAQQSSNQSGTSSSTSRDSALSALARVHSRNQGQDTLVTGLRLQSLPDTPLNLDFDKASARSALKKVFESAKVDYVIDNDVPETETVTLRVENAKLPTVLDLITQAAGIGWRQEMRDNKPLVHVGKSLFGATSLPLVWQTPSLIQGTTLDYSTALGSVYTLNSSAETRSTFVCPHCKGQVTVLRRASQPKCPTCGRTFQRDWKFCPFDGAKRPPDPNGWKFCPLCGKPVQMAEFHDADDLSTTLYGNIWNNQNNLYFKDNDSTLLQNYLRASQRNKTNKSSKTQR